MSGVPVGVEASGVVSVMVMSFQAPFGRVAPLLCSVGALIVSPAPPERAAGPVRIATAAPSAAWHRYSCTRKNFSHPRITSRFATSGDAPPFSAVTKRPFARARRLTVPSPLVISSNVSQPSAADLFAMSG